MAALLLGGCDRTNAVTVKVLKPSDCDGPDPMENVAYVRVRFVNATRCGPADDNGDQHCVAPAPNDTKCGADADCGFGAKLLEKIAKVDAAKIPFDSLENNRPMQVQMAGFDGDPKQTSSQILSYGQSAPFTVPSDKVAADQIVANVFFRQVEKFSPVCTTDADGNIVKLTLANSRAGHTATVLDDGKVLIAGGFDTANISAGNLKNPQFWNYTETAEMFDPLTGQFLPDVPAMAKIAVATPRAFHSAVKLAANQVLVTGGEYSSKTSPRTMATRTETILFDPTPTEDGSNGSWAPVVAPPVKRSRHTISLEKSGRYLLYGGLYWGDTSVATNTPIYSNYFEWYTPDTNPPFTKEDQPWGAANTVLGHAATPVYSGTYVITLGGSTEDGTNNAGKLDSGTGVRILQFLNGKFSAYGNIRTPTPRSYVATGGAGHYYLMIGGFTDFDPANYSNFFLNTPSNLVDVIYLKQIDKTNPGPPLTDVPRGHICAVTLNDGRVLATGGRGGLTAIGSVASVGVFTNNGNSDPALAFGYTKLDDLADARYFHTCTVLLDGTVLVTGGVKEKGASFDTLNSMEIYVPRPAAD